MRAVNWTLLETNTLTKTALMTHFKNIRVIGLLGGNIQNHHWIHPIKS